MDAVLLQVVDALESLGIPYMLVGSLSSNFYGITRSTKDADIVVDVGPGAIRDVATRLGPPFQLERQMTFETVTSTTRVIVTVQGTGTKVEFFRLSEDEHDRKRFQRKRRVSLPAIGREVNIATAEDVVITKLRWAVGAARGKDRDDVRDVIVIQGDSLDWPYIESWCDRHGTRVLLDEIRQAVKAAEEA